VSQRDAHEPLRDSVHEEQLALRIDEDEASGDAMKQLQRQRLLLLRDAEPARDLQDTRKMR
jgi:hypothetical protein